MFFLENKVQYFYPYASMNDVQATGEPPALKKEHPALQNMKFRPCFSSFLWFLFALLDPDPDQGNNNKNNPQHRQKLYHVYIECKEAKII
jgi:hypothetical protein